MRITPRIAASWRGWHVGGKVRTHTLAKLSDRPATYIEALRAVLGGARGLHGAVVIACARVPKATWGLCSAPCALSEMVEQLIEKGTMC